MTAWKKRGTERREVIRRNREGAGEEKEEREGGGEEEGEVE